MPYLVGYPTPQDYGALGDNSHDDTTAIQNAINATPVDGVLYFPPGRYRTSAPLIIPPGVTLLGDTQRRPRNSFMSYPSVTDMAQISPFATFSGSAVISIPDALSGSFSTMAQATVIRGIKVNCQALPNGGGVDGIRVTGQVQGLILDNVSVLGPSGYCFNFINNASVTSGPTNPFSLRLRGCFATGGGTATTTGGFFVYNCTDSTFIDCETIAVGGDGWNIQGGGNTVFTNCRSENNSGNGFTISKTSGGTNASVSMVGCSTNANSGHGFSVSFAQSVNLASCTSNGDGATSAGFNVSSSTGFVTLENCVSSSGASSQYGLQFGSTLNLRVDGGSFYGSTAGLNDTGANTNIFMSSNVALLTGSSATPTVAIQGLQTGKTGVSGPLEVTSQAIGIPTPYASHSGAIAWTYDPAQVTSGQTGTAGTMYLASVYVSRSATTATKLFWGINTAGSGATAGQNFIGLYNSAGTRLASIGVDARVTTTGLFTETISAAISPGQYWVAFLFNATGMPAIYRAGFLNGTLVNFNSTAAGFRFATNGTALTALPASITPSSNSTAMYTYWAALG